LRFRLSSPFYHENHFKIYEKVVSDEVVWPNTFEINPTVKDFITKLLNKDKSKRLGNGPRGTLEVKNHPFFFGVDWSQVARQEIKAPLIPKTDNPGDTRNFERYKPVGIENFPGIYRSWLRSMGKVEEAERWERMEDPHGHLFPVSLYRLLFFFNKLSSFTFLLTIDRISKFIITASFLFALFFRQ
jgi:serine/threonine protein kinase